MSAINRSLLASAAASVMSTTSTASTKSAKSLKGAACSPEGVSLDAYVRRAWSSLSNGVVSVAPDAFSFGYRTDKNAGTEVGGEAAVTADTYAAADVPVDIILHADVDAHVNADADAGVEKDGEVVIEVDLELDDKENINAGSDIDAGRDADKGVLPNSMDVLFERYVPKAPDLKTSTMDAERPFEHKERDVAARDRSDEDVQKSTLPLPLIPLQVLIPPRPENIKMGLQIGKGFSKTPSIGASAVPQADVPARASRAGLSVIPQFSNAVKTISKRPPSAETAPAAMSMQMPKPEKTELKPAAPDTDAIYGDAGLSLDAPQKPVKTAAKQTKVQVPEPTSAPKKVSTKKSVLIQTPTPIQTQQPATHSVDMSRKEKPLPRIASDAPVPPPPLIQGMQEKIAIATPDSSALSQDRARHSPQPGQQQATVPAAKTDAAVSATAGSTLTYRFDKWNGNHAVTVQNIAQTSLQNNPQPNTQYSLSPSDDLVSQRLSEHLARTADAQNAPSMRLTDADERQRRQGQGQAQQDDEEDET